jgi:putative ABC transport system permease protein
MDTVVTSLVPIGSMLIANAMNTNSLVLNRFCSEVESHTGLIETALALGADSKESVAPYVEVSCRRV